MPPRRQNASPFNPLDCLTPDEARTLASYGRLSTDPLVLRDGLICRFLLSTGLRRSELASIRPEALRQWDSRTWAVIIGKGGKLRWVPLSDQLLEELAALRLALHTQSVIPAWDPGFHNIRSASSRTIYRAVARAGVATLGRRIHPHLLRHTAATLMLAAGAPLQGVQGILGHSHVTTTERYLHRIPNLMSQAASDQFYASIGVYRRVHPSQIELRLIEERSHG